MSDLREELEQGFSSADEQSETQVTNGNAVEEQTTSQEPAVTDEWMDAPKAYKQEYQESFKTLSPEWRKYLIDREKQVERGFSEQGNKLSSYKWADDAFSTRQERLGQMGFTKAQEYIEHLTAIDDALAKDPVGTLRALSEAYGVDVNNNDQISNSFAKRIAEMEQSLANQQAYIRQQQTQTANQAFEDFTNAKDDAGNLKHPHWEDVRSDMANLIQKGICTTLEDAYERAIWSNKDVREKMIAAQAKAELDSKVAAADKAKEVAFSPKSKQTAPERDLSLREELEAAFRG
jgi:hypothetical protein